MPLLTLTERIYLDADGRATTDPERGQSLWGTPGMDVQVRDAEAVGYAPPEYVAPRPKAVRRPKGTKVVEGPGGDK